ncbi:MAG: LicD family protein [Ruminococcaceae bacterium]|nr:LicD family protein [Oscillospiraceae bacterium]
MDNQNTNSILKKLQLEELGLLTELDRVCRKHKLNYYIVGGTLIGAVRHKGFIPWDDDIDVSMPRKDFNKLCKLSKTEFGEKYFFQTHKTEKNCSFHYAKLRKNGTYFGEEKFEHQSFHKGIFMDIFPLDYIPENKLLQKLLFKGFGLFSGLISSKDKSDEYLFKNKSGLFVFILKCIRCITPKFLLQAFRSLLTKLSNLLANKKLLASFSGFHGYPKEIAPALWWADGTELTFEGKSVMAPKEYKTLLTHMFGDFMELPPEEERITHNVDLQKIVFDGATVEDYKPKINKKRIRKNEYKVTP